jgi:predicted  nucleic acid-binding Zn-ribbon protein
MTWEFFLDHAYQIIGLAVLLLSVVISPVVLIRWLRTRNELTEMTTFIKKNKLVREEIAEINERFNAVTEELHEVKKKLHAHELAEISYRAKEEAYTIEIKRLTEENHQLLLEIKELKAAL